MSVDSKTFMIGRDSINLAAKKYWYKLQYLPIMDSLRVSFDLSNNITEFKFNDYQVYNYDIIETYVKQKIIDFFVVKIVSTGSMKYWDNGILMLPYTSQESDIYAKELIGKRIVIGNQLILIDESNYLSYKSYLVDNVFIDFSISEKIISIIDSIDPETKTLLHDELECCYFYEIF